MTVIKEVSQVIDYNDFDRYINETFPQFNNKFACVGSEEWHNYSEYSFEVSYPLGKEYDELVERIENYNEKSHWVVRDLLEFLASQQIIELGKVTIKVSW